MKYTTFLHPAFFILSLLFLCLEITTAIKIGAGNYTCSDKERDALLNFKSYIQHDPHGLLSNWTLDEGADNDCCRWSGVKCDDQTGHVTSLDLSEGLLEGKISHSLLNLSYLNHLDLSENSYSGTIPKFIGSMTQLKHLNLDWNDFSGTIPSELGNLTNLNFLDLYHNQFSGTFPLFIGSMNQLTDLDLGENTITGTIPLELGNLTNLHYLSLQNLRNCTIENLEWLSRLSKLENLHMGGISLAKIDNWVNVILNLQKLTDLSLSECNLWQVMHPYSNSSVSVNSSFSSSIVELYLGHNNLNSSMYHWLFPLTSNKLEELDLSGNKLDGIPKYLGNFCSLRKLYLDYSSIAIKFSDFLNILSGCTSVSLQHLYAIGNQLTGPLSDNIQKFQSLRYLSLSSNHLKGTVSEKIWQLPKLNVLSTTRKTAFLDAQCAS